VNQSVTRFISLYLWSTGELSKVLEVTRFWLNEFPLSTASELVGKLDDAVSY
jgi:hypothetical protein